MTFTMVRHDRGGRFGAYYAHIDSEAMRSRCVDCLQERLEQVYNEAYEMLFQMAIETHGRLVDQNEVLESQNQALQERAERAERLLQAIAFDDQGKLQAWLQPLYIREPYVTVLVDKATQFLSPTQETDPE